MRLNREIILLAATLLFSGYKTGGSTIATFNTTVGNMELELYDSDKPVTVSNFIKYVTSGRFQNQFIQRWEPNFVIQAGGYYVGSDTNNATDFRTIPIFGTITNEYSLGRNFSNIYGTIAMARQSGNTNSASSQWFLNLTNNAFLDKVDGGFTVFGRITAGTNILNLFIPSPPNAGDLRRVNIPPYFNSYHEPIVLDTLPVTNNVTTFSQVFTNLIYVNISLRRDLGVQIKSIGPNQRQITWNSVAGVTNVVESSSTLAGPWTILSQTVGTGGVMTADDSSSNNARIYRVKLFY
jgi:cyclophilin family peptidyl-prolyl cis-trans isomerase